METRAWFILLDLAVSGEPAVHAVVEDDTLLNGRVCRQPIEALRCVEEVLVDFRAGDEITLVALREWQPLVAWTTRVRSVALHWCAIMLSEAASGSSREPRRVRGLS